MYLPWKESSPGPRTHVLPACRLPSRAPSTKHSVHSSSLTDVAGVMSDGGTAKWQFEAPGWVAEEGTASAAPRLLFWGRHC